MTAMARPHRKIGALVGLLLAVGPLSACAPEVSDVEAIGACATDADCASGTTCYARRLCVALPKQKARVFLQMVPPVGSGLVTEQFESEVGGVDHVEPQTWTLTAPAVVHGTVGRGSIAESVPGTLLATTPGAMEGTTLSYKASSEAATEFAESGHPDRSFGFQLRVQLGHSYEVLFWPKEPTIPPYYTTHFVGGQKDIWEIALPGESSDPNKGAQSHLITVSGRLVSAPVSPPDCEATPAVAPEVCEAPGCQGVAGLRLRLRDGEGRTRSTTVVTDDKGHFAVSVDPAAGQVWLRFEPDNPGATLPTGTWATPIDLAALRAGAQVDHDLGLLRLGVLPALTSVEPTVESSAGVPVEGARINIKRALVAPLRCVLTDGGWKTEPAILGLHYAFSVLTDEQGRVVAPLPNAGQSGPKVTYGHALSMPPGVATFTLLPASLDPAGLLKTDRAVETLSILTCPSRPLVRGAVMDYDGRAIISAKVVFRPLVGVAPQCPGALGEFASLPPKAILLNADAEGAYQARLDPGRYAAMVQPPPHSGLASALVEVFDVCPGSGSDATTFPTIRVDLKLPPPTVLTGRILGPDHKPAAGVRIEVMAGALSALQAPLKGAGKGGAGSEPMEDTALVRDTHLLGEGITDEKGRYEILIAAGQLAPLSP